MVSETLDRLVAWYQSQCDGDWEHGEGIEISTLDNPGWSIRVSVVDTALDAVVTMDSRGFITGWNPQAESTFGWSSAEAIGMLLTETIIPPQHRKAHRDGLEHLLDTGVSSWVRR